LIFHFIIFTFLRCFASVDDPRRQRRSFDTMRLPSRHYFIRLMRGNACHACQTTLRKPEETV